MITLAAVIELRTLACGLMIRVPERSISPLASPSIRRSRSETYLPLKRACGSMTLSLPGSGRRNSIGLGVISAPSSGKLSGYRLPTTSSRRPESALASRLVPKTTAGSFLFVAEHNVLAQGATKRRKERKPSSQTEIEVVGSQGDR